MVKRILRWLGEWWYAVLLVVLLVWYIASRSWGK